MSVKRAMRALENLSVRIDLEHARIVQLQMKVDDILAIVDSIDPKGMHSYQSDAVTRLRAISWDFAGVSDKLQESIHEVDQSFDAIEAIANAKSL